MNRRQLLKGLIALPIAGAAAAALPGDGVALRMTAHPRGTGLIPATKFYKELRVGLYHSFSERYARAFEASLRRTHEELENEIYGGPTTDAGLAQLVRSG